MKEIWKRDASERKVFARGGTTYYQVFIDMGRHYCIYDIMSNYGEHRGYELFKLKKTTNPDGSEVYILPGDEEFGRNAWTTIGTENTYPGEIEDIVNKVSDKIFKDAIS